MVMAEEKDFGRGEEAKKKKSMRDLIEKVKLLPFTISHNLWKVGREDPRRVIHALKVGVALTLVSFLYVLEPLFKGVGQNAMWAVMTVVVVFEFTAGATLCKGMNRGFGTIMAGSLAFFIEFVSEKSGKVCRAVFIGVSVFLVGFAATYVRFVPYIKKNYDYGVLIFLLTFNLITVSSFRVQNVLHIARERLYTIVIGCSICLVMSLLILPNWSGEDLHHYTADKLEGLARSIEVCVNEYFQDEDIKDETKDTVKKGYKTVLDSRTSDESLAMFASWEPRHSRRCDRYPWQMYVKLGVVLRHFGYAAVALHGCLESEIQTPQSVRSLFRDPCNSVAREISRVLSELGRSIRNRRRFSTEVLSDQLHEALQDLNNAIKSQPRLFLGLNNAHATTNMLTALRSSDKEPSSSISLPSAKTDVSGLLASRSKRVADQSKETAERKVLRPTLSKLAITSLEFSEALPFAAFASLLVEMVARLDLIIQEVEELGRAAHFKEFVKEEDIKIELNNEVKGRHGRTREPPSNDAGGF